MSVEKRTDGRLCLCTHGYVCVRECDDSAARLCSAQLRTRCWRHGGLNLPHKLQPQHLISTVNLITYRSSDTQTRSCVMYTSMRLWIVCIFLSYFLCYLRCTHSIMAVSFPTICYAHPRWLLPALKGAGWQQKSIQTYGFEVRVSFKFMHCFDLIMKTEKLARFSFLIQNNESFYCGYFMRVTKHSFNTFFTMLLDDWLLTVSGFPNSTHIQQRIKTARWLNG